MAAVTAVRQLICIAPNPSIDKTAEIERLVPGAIHRPDRLLAVPGGKGLNVARAARHLGAEVIVVAPLAGHAGRWIDEELERRGIPRVVVWVPGETRTCLSVLDRSTGTLSEFYEAGPTIPAADWAGFMRAVASTIAESPRDSVVALSGSLPPGVVEADVGEIVDAARRSGRQIVVDLGGLGLRAAVDASPDVVKVNAMEAASVAEIEVSSEAAALSAAQRLVEFGAGQAVVTRGSAGAVAWDGATGCMVEPDGDAGPYLVGSGDAFLAGFAVSLMAGEALPDRLRAGAGAAASNTEGIGAGEISRASADRHRSRIKVRPVRSRR